MTKLEFLKWCFDNIGYDDKGCLQGMITIQFEDDESSGQFKKLPFTPFVEKGSYHCLVEGSQIAIEGDVKEPLFYMDDILELPGDFHPVLKGKPVRTTFGLFLFNVILVWEPFNGVVDYINKEFTKPLWEGIFRKIMVSNPKPGETVPEGKASVDDCLRFSHNTQFLEGLGSHFIKPAGIDAFTVDPRVLELKAKLMKERAHELTDPVVTTSIIDQCVALDMELMMKGPSRKFFIAKKFIDNSRKRMFIAFGIEPSADGGWVFLSNSLDEGWDPEYLADYINTSVAGSYSRSMATGEGGAEVKNTIRLIGRAYVDDTNPDCNTPVLEMITIEETGKHYWVGSWVKHKEALVQITNDNVDKFVGKPTPVRVPQFCILEKGSYCKTCCGEGLGALGERLSAEIVLIPTSFMLTRMKAAHIAGASTGLIDIELALK